MPKCLWCEKAKQFLDDVDENWNSILLEKPEEREAFLDARGIEAPNRTFPRIYIRAEDGTETLVGGYRELLQRFMPH